MTTATGLAKLTVNTPQRRIDVALPEQAPLGELLPDLLRHAGVGLADEGQAHGGWALRRADGTALSPGAGLVAQGVRDGDVLYLGSGQDPWPELEYDDVVDAIAAGARGYGRVWDGAATRTAGLAVAAVALLFGTVVLLRAPQHAAVPGLVGLGAALLLTLGGTLASRAYADSAAGALLAAAALPYAFAGGLLVLAPGATGRGGLLSVASAAERAPRLLVGSVAVLVVAAVGAVGIGDRLRIFVAALAAGCAGVLGAGLGYRLAAGPAAAIVLAVLVIGAAAIPLLAMRLGNLPVPVLTPGQPERLDRARVHAAAVRADEILAGLLCGLAVAATAAAVPLARWDTGGRVLVAVAAAGFLVRARLFPAVRHRLPLLVAGAGTAGALLVRVPATVPVVIGALTVALLCLVSGLRYRDRPPGPYLGRVADLLDALCVISVIPAACAVLGLYGAVRGLAG